MSITALLFRWREEPMISFSGNFQTTSETKGTKQEQEESTDEDPSLSLFSHKIYDWIQKSISLGQF